MARVCDLTGKKTRAGKSRRHQRGKAGGVSGTWSKKAPATNRTFRPNLVKNVKVVDVDGKVKKLTLSTKVLKRMRKFGHYQGIQLVETMKKSS